MAKKYILQVPADKPAGFPEFVTQGNFQADLTQETVETTEANFARWLVAEYGLEDVTPEVADDDGGADEPSAVPGEYPEDFPRREVLIENNISIDTARGLDRDQLIALNGIGEKSADAILEFFNSTGGAQ